MIHLGIPVMDQHELTQQCLEYLYTNTAIPGQLHVTIFDNDSAIPFDPRNSPLDVDVRRYEENLGYYRPLAVLAEKATTADIVGLIHNDLFITEFGWDNRLRDAFLKYTRTGLIGFCGSSQVDARGGRGGGTMCNFKGVMGQSAEQTGARMVGYARALVLDSLAMFFRQPTVSVLGIDEHTAPCHFYDKIWCLRTLKAQQDVGVLGIECEHLGGMTAVANPAYRDHALLWCDKEGIIPSPDPEAAVYNAAETIWLTEGRRFGLIPADPAATVNA